MGFFDFVRGAGEKLFGKDDDAEQAAKADPGKPQYDAAFVGKQLTHKVNALDLDVEGLQVSFEDGRATVKGTVPDRRTAELVVLTLGNTTIVDGVDDQLTIRAPAPEVAADEPAEPPSPPATFHTVVKGDTLWAIASKHYGTGHRYKEIFEANTPMLSDPNLIYPGQVLRIPGSELVA